MKALALVMACCLASIGAVIIAPAASAANCTVDSGVLVVVDYGPLGAPAARRCDATVPDTGYDALVQAGFHLTGTVHDGPDFVCRIDNKPDTSRERCVDTPPATAFWSYWLGDVQNNTWTFSQFGAKSSTPMAGEVQAWSFGDGKAPSMTVASLFAVNSAKPGNARAQGTTATPFTPEGDQRRTDGGHRRADAAPPHARAGAAQENPTQRDPHEPTRHEKQSSPNTGRQPGVGPGGSSASQKPSRHATAHAPTEPQPQPRAEPMATGSTLGDDGAFPIWSVVAIGVLWILGTVVAVAVRRRRKLREQ